MRARAKIYANYAQYYEAVPLDLDGPLRDSASLGGVELQPCACDPRDPGRTCNSNASRIPLDRLQPIWNRPVRRGQVAGRSRLEGPLDRASSSWGANTRSEKSGKIGLSYTKRWLNSAIEDMSRDEGSTFFIGNPGSGVARRLPQSGAQLRRRDALLPKDLRRRMARSGELHPLLFARKLRGCCIARKTANSSPQQHGLRSSFVHHQSFGAAPVRST